MRVMRQTEFAHGNGFRPAILIIQTVHGGKTAIDTDMIEMSEIAVDSSPTMAIIGTFAPMNVTRLWRIFASHFDGLGLGSNHARSCWVE
jgi:hypothetical protein